MDDCTSCHRAANASLKCDSCHVDRREKKGPRGAWQVTHGRDWRHMHGMGDLATCVTCHEQGYCKSCHRVELPHPADFGTRHGVEAEKDAAACTVCHQRVSFCDACHGMPMPHPDGFLEGHPRLARGDSDPRCSRCHVAGDCANCHSMHVHPGGSRGMPAPKVH